jgi:branched-chain amino acid transport system ATP-binding protein
MSPSAAAPLLAVEGLSVRFGGVIALDGVSFEVAGGQICGLIGPNGAGKTTLFNLIAGDISPSGGRVLFAGSDMTAMAPHARSRLGIGRSYQIPHPFANMSVFENLLVGAIFGGGATESESYLRCSDVLKVTGLYDKANVPARTLTLLQRKRLELARALAIQPKLLLLDEIAGGLTEYECGELVKTIKEIHARGTTIVWIEHIVHALVSVASRLIVMNFGQVLAQGNPHEVMADARVREVYMGIPLS